MSDSRDNNSSVSSTSTKEMSLLPTSLLNLLHDGMQNGLEYGNLMLLNQ